MPRRIKQPLPDDYIENLLNWLGQQAKENKREHEEEERHLVKHACGHSHWYRRVPKEELRQQLEQVDCPLCQKSWNITKKKGGENHEDAGKVDTGNRG